MSANITVVGNIASDPELKFFDSGTAYVNFAVAVGSRKKDETGTWVDGDTSWFDCTVFDAQAENFAVSLTKGTRVVVTGTQTQRKYTDKEGNERTAFNIRVEEVAPSLKWASASVTRNPKKDASENTSRSAQAPARRAEPPRFNDEPF